MKWHIDLKRCNRMDLEMAGLDSSKIMDSAICTFDSVEDYFSARRLESIRGASTMPLSYVSAEKTPLKM